VLLAIPAFNEERFIGSTVLQARSAGLEVTVIDDGSSDRTAEIAAMAGAQVERHQRNQGKAEALNTALRIARERQVEVLVVLDGDGQHQPAEVERVLGPVLNGEADIVVGSRFLEPTENSIPGIRRLGQRAVTFVTNSSSGMKLTDSQSGFRAFSRTAIDSLQFASRGFGAEVEMQFRARDHRLKLKEIAIEPVYLDPPKRNVFGHGLQVFNWVLFLTSRHRPLLFFSLPGMLLLLAGLSLDVLVVDIYQHTHLLATGYALVSVLCNVGGLLSVFSGLLLHSMRGSFVELERRFASFSNLIAAQLAGLQFGRSTEDTYEGPVVPPA
jgi:glycosyltransferase involved in cell wall biosynthesis